MLVTHRFVTVRGIRVHVAEAGAGPALVLQHGFLLALRGFWYMPLLGTPLLGSALLRSRRFSDLVLRWAHPGLGWDGELRDSYTAPIRRRRSRRGAARRL